MSGLDGLGWANPEDEPKPKTMNDTPETDAEVNELKSATTYNMVWAEFARKLERERDEAREKLKWRMHWVETLRRVGRKLRKERDEARERIKNNPWCEACSEPDCCVSGDGTCAMIRKYLLAKSVDAKLATVTEQRDKLAEALRKLADCDWVITLPNRMDAVRTIAAEALKSLTP